MTPADGGPAAGDRTTGTARPEGRILRLLGRPALALGFLSLLANAIPGAALFLYLEYVSKGAGRVAHPARAADTMLVVFGVFVVVAVPIGVLEGIRSFSGVLRWLAHDRPATPAEQLGLLRRPVSRAVVGFCFWAAAALVFGISQAALGYPAHRIVVVVAAILLAGVSASSLTALLVERLLRPAVHRALGGSLPSRPLGIGVLPRLLLGWAFGSAVPLVGLLLLPIDHGGALGDLTLPLALLCVAGLVSGFTITTGAARAVAEPLGDIRRALQQVEAGDLGVEVRVDDGSEVGQLQAGVNRMVLGLREQRRLEDLFGRYVGAEVAGRALERGVDLSGERCEATVLFVDLVGSTALATRSSPEEVVRTLNAYFAAVVGAVQPEAGWVNKFEGDGALCVFGPPGGRTDHAGAGLRAALTMGRAVEAAAVEHPGLVAAIGVATGTVVAGTIGSTERFEYTVVGDPVNQAARLCELAKSGAPRTLTTEATIRAAGYRADPAWAEAGEVTLRGRPAPTRLYRAA